MFEELPPAARVVRHERVRDRRLRLRSVLTAIFSVGMVLAGALATDVIAQAAVTGCRVTYSVGSEWPGGFTGNVTVTNLGDSASGWRVAWTFPDGQRVTQSWGATIHPAPTGLVATNPAWSSHLGTNATVSFGFNGWWSGTNGPPALFTLNGVPCTGSVGTTPPATGPKTP